MGGKGGDLYQMIVQSCHVHMERLSRAQCIGEAWYDHQKKQSIDESAEVYRSEKLSVPIAI